MIRVLLIALVGLFSLAAASVYQVMQANQKIGKLESTLATVATQYGQARARYDQLDVLTAARQEARTHERDRLQAQLEALRSIPPNECLDRRVPGAVVDILHAYGPGDSAMPSGTGGAGAANSSP